MALQPRSRLGPYEIVSPLGAGGMGEVYRARDTKLNRDVALKVLPESFALDLDRVARFRREAQVLASLNHSNIGAIYGLEESNGVTALVLELVEGPTLAERIAQGPMPLEDALPIVRQIAEALEAAHEQGIIHRDLKPANIKLRPDGTVKVLDFGLAKALASDSAVALAGSASMSPTLTTPAMTGMGVILGTAAYMSPEQAKGRPADKRSDIWAFGCVLYEMLTGRRAFDGEDVGDTMAAVLRGEPDWTALPQGLPPATRALLERCLTKDRGQRIGEISTALFLLRDWRALTTAPPPATRVVPTAWWKRSVPLAAGAVVASAAIAALVSTPASTPAPVARFELTLPEGHQFSGINRRLVAISPDGTQIAYGANARLYLRSISDIEPRAIPGTEALGNPLSPTFSPDGRSLAFWASSDGTLKRISVTGGAAVTICPVPLNPLGISWANEAILFAQLGVGILRVSPNGGKPDVVVPLTTGQEGNSADVAYGPQLLPNGALLFTLSATPGSDRWDKANVVVQSLQSGERKTLLAGGSDARYVPTGHLVYALGGTLFAVPFNPDRLEVTAGPVPVVEGVRRVGTVAGTAQFAFSDTGSLVYVPGPASAGGQLALALSDRKGGVEVLKLPAGSYAFPRVSPDGTRVALEIDDGREAAVWVYELSGTSSMRRLTFGGNNRYPVWSADSRRIAFQSDRERDRGIFWQPADGGVAERLTTAAEGTAHVPNAWSPDGDTLLYDVSKGTAVGLWAFSLRQKKAAEFDDVRAEGLPTGAVFSPDGQWVAYQASASGRDYTFVQPFPPTGVKFQIGSGGRPLWSRDGKELFFVPAPGQFVSVAVTTRPGFTFTPPVSVPRAFPTAEPGLPRPFDATNDGRFVVVTAAGQGQGGAVAASRLHIVLNWFDELKRLVPLN